MSGKKKRTTKSLDPPNQLRILVIDEDKQRGETLAGILRLQGYDVVDQTTSYPNLLNLVEDAQPDVVLIDLTSPDRDTLEQLTLVNKKSPRPVVMFAQDDDAKTIQSAVRAGVSTYIVDGLATRRVTPIINMAIAHFRQYQSMRDELERTKTTLEERRYVDQAKALLMKQKKLEEADAYAMLRKFAMDRKQRIGQVAKQLIDAASLLEGVKN